MKAGIKRDAEKKDWDPKELEVNDHDLCQEMGKELDQSTKIKREVLQDVDQYAEMLFTINKAKLGDAKKWKELIRRLPSRLSNEWESYCDIDLHT